MPEEYKNRNYAKGYKAGRAYVDKEILELRREVQRLERETHEKREERIYFNALNTVLAHCHNWKLGDKPINSSEGYGQLAKIFAQHAITNIEEISK
jgi:hypothetical protein